MDSFAGTQYLSVVFVVASRQVFREEIKDGLSCQIVFAPGLQQLQVRLITENEACGCILGVDVIGKVINESAQRFRSLARDSSVRKRVAISCLKASLEAVSS
jgi:hypothetical protein